MVFTLQRYIFRELFRIFLMATVGLTLILSLGMILQPVQEYGVGPKQVVHLLVYFMPVTLTFVLPMAALFASALTYGRFASDNELNACRASGISLWTYVYPGLALALLVATANLLLSFHVMPYFVHLAEQSFKADAKQIVFRNIQLRGYFEWKSSGTRKSKLLIYADYADPERNTLYGIVAVQSTKEGIGRICTAEQATVHFDAYDNVNEVQLSISKARYFQSGEGIAVTHVGQSSLRHSFESPLDDDIKFKKINEMKRIGEDPMLFEPIAGRAQEIYKQLVTELLADEITRTLRSSHGPGYYELRGPTRTIRLSASACELKKEQTIALISPVIVEEYDPGSGQRLKRLQCEEKEAILTVGQESPNPRLSLELPGARNQLDDTLEMSHFLNDLSLPDAVSRRLGQGSPLQIAQNSQRILAGTPPSSLLAKEQKDLASKMASMFVDIKTEMNSRLVFGIGCVPMILIGIGLGIINRGGHLLSAFGASCAPAAVLIVGIVSGRQVAGNAGAQVFSGVAIMWGGLTLLAFVTAFIYRRLMRT